MNRVQRLRNRARAKSCGLGQRGTHHVLRKNRAGHLDGSDLQFSFGSEVGKEAAFAHFQLLGEATDCQTSQSLNRTQIDGYSQDSFAGPLAFAAVPGISGTYGPC